MTVATVPFPDFLPPSPPGGAYLALARRFVEWLLKRWPGLRGHAEDLEQEAAIAALLAARCFEPGRGVGFLTFAWWKMRGAATRYLRKAVERKRLLRALASQLPAPLGPVESVQVPYDAALVVNLLRPVLLEATRPQRHRYYPRALGASAVRDVELFLAVLMGESLAEVGRRCGVTRERARQIVERLKPAFETWKLSLH